MPQSKPRSACLDLRPYLLKCESREELEALGQSIVDQTKPVGALEECLVRTVILALWNIQRWAKLETSLLNSASDALTLFRSPAATALLKMIQRRLTSEDSRHYRSMAEIRRLQKERAMAQAPAQPAETKPDTENWLRSSKSQNGASAQPDPFPAAAKLPDNLSEAELYALVEQQVAEFARQNKTA
jgi:hypothetical protein